MSPRTVEVRAPAKVNLTLHVTGRRADGYHLLDSLVCFAEDAADRITVALADETRLTVAGPFATSVPVTDDNLVLRAASLLGVSAEITLDKRLPVASGIGGGSADAAATLEALTTLSNCPMPGLDELLTLGADVPVCAIGGLVWMRGIGEEIVPLHNRRFPWSLVLVNPGVAVSTPEVFAALDRRDNAPMDAIPAVSDDAFLGWLAEQRNDLEAPAIAVAPVIGDVLTALRDQPGALVSRMSGSGATCYALFADERLARAAVGRIAAAQPDWWVVLGND